MINRFLFSWLCSGQTLWLAGSWLDVEIDRLFQVATAWQRVSRPVLYYVGGPGIRVLGPPLALQAVQVAIQTN